jgi:mono/diheme cytochrome c family protein
VAIPRPGPPGAAAPTAHVADKEKGKETYTTTCVVCHGENGKGGTHGGAPFTPKLTHDSVVTVLTRGRNDMPPFGASMSPDALEDLTAWVLDLAVR